ncbi:hypothetical protein X731_26055 [Mesorhizobium sp. L2C054A000]|nr:hypothetical protein X731_26055 [Mesorhizobium sp. L2C054A000]
MLGYFAARYHLSNPGRDDVVRHLDASIFPVIGYAVEPFFNAIE